MRVRFGPRGLLLLLGVIALVAAACSSSSGVTVAQGQSPEPTGATGDFDAVLRDSEPCLDDDCSLAGQVQPSEGGAVATDLPMATADGSTHLGAGTDAMADTFGDDPVLDELWTACDDGDLAACDELYATSPFGSDYEAFALECGGRSADQYGTCQLELGDGGPADEVAVSGPSELGDDGGFDVLYNACGAGVLDACDDLYTSTPIGSGYEAYGSTCGETTDEQYGGCTELLGGDDGLDYESRQPGEDPGNDLLYGACLDDNMAACDVLYVNAAFGSEYERLALSCGGRRDHVGASPDCARSF